MKKVATVYRGKAADGIEIYERPDGTAQHDCASGPGVRAYPTVAAALQAARLILGNPGRVGAPPLPVRVRRQGRSRQGHRPLTTDL